MDENNITMSSYCGEDAHNVWFFQFVLNFDKIQWTTYLMDISVMVRIITLLITYQYYSYNGEKVMNCTRKFNIFLTYKFMKKHWLQPIQKLCAITNPNWIVVRMGHTTMDHAKLKANPWKETLRYSKSKGKLLSTWTCMYAWESFLEKRGE